MVPSDSPVKCEQCDKDFTFLHEKTESHLLYCNMNAVKHYLIFFKKVTFKVTYLTQKWEYLSVRITSVTHCYW